MTKTLKLIIVLITGILFVSIFALDDERGDNGYGKYNCRVKNVIMLIPDGCDATVQTIARWVKGKELTIDKLNRAAVKTHMSNSVITGSAAASTAYACGHKTTARFLGIGPRTDNLLSTEKSRVAPYSPLVSILEAAKMKRKSTGLVSTSRITHATPAAFYSHIHDRGMDNEIMEHLVYQNVDVVFGGGARHLIPKNETYTTSFGENWAGKRIDGENLLNVLLRRGVQFVDNQRDMNNTTRGPVWGLFDDSHMDPDLDRDELHPTQPSLSHMTNKAIEILSQDPDGFFLMVEGSQIDWGGHANDPVYMVHDFLAFDKAVAEAVRFAKRNRQTLVLVFPDHSTGALSLGHQQSDFPPDYTATTVEDVVLPIKDAKITLQALVRLLPTCVNPEEIRHFFSDNLGTYWNSMSDEIAQNISEMINAKGANAYYEVAKYISTNMTVFGWTTHGHSGEDVPVWSYGPMSPEGTIDNTKLAKIAAKVFGVNLNELTKRLYINIKDVFPKAIIDDTVEGNARVIIGDAVLYEGKDIITIRGFDYRLNSIAVHAPKINTFFISRSAIRMIVRM